MSNPEADRADSPPLDADDRAIILARKSGALTSKFEASNDLAHLNEAITLAQEAIALAEWDGYDSQFNNNLGRALRLRFIASRQDEDLEAAIRCGRQSLISKPDSAGRALFLANLSDTLAVKFGETGDEQILQEALQLARDAVEVSAAGGAFRGEAVSTLTSRHRHPL
jgi:tetratricopeptide (TPR) repeat protein